MCGCFPAARSTARAPTTRPTALTAVRELEEEAGVALPDPAELVPFARWITPGEVKVRYDTWFYLALAPAHSSPEPDGEEIVETAWLTPAEALERHGRGELLLVFPTIHKLQVLSKYETAEEALAAARRGERRADPAASRRQRRRAPHPAAGRLGLLEPSANRSRQRTPVQTPAGGPA